MFVYNKNINFFVFLVNKYFLTTNTTIILNYWLKNLLANDIIITLHTKICRRTIMKKFFRAIGNFFARIWRWIKETAWVQPLLIVCLIFGVILLIQPISEGVVALGDLISNNKKYFKDNKVSLLNNSAYDLIYDETARFKDNDKYFLVFVAEDCPNCNEVYQGFKTLIDDETFTGDYKLKTIYVDQQNDDYDMHTDKEAEMNKLFFTDSNDEVIKFRETLYAVATSYSEYYLEVADDTYDGYLTDIANGEDLYTPLVLLIDKEYEENDFNIKEVLVGVHGSSKYDKARTLDNCWNSVEEFARD